MDEDINVVEKLRAAFGTWPEENRENLRRHLAAGTPVFVGDQCSGLWAKDKAG